MSHFRSVAVKGGPAEQLSIAPGLSAESVPMSVEGDIAD